MLQASRSAAAACSIGADTTKGLASARVSRGLAAFVAAACTATHLKLSLSMLSPLPTPRPLCCCVQSLWGEEGKLSSAS